MDNVTRYKITESSQSSSQAYYHLSFELSEQQSYASEHIVRAIRMRQTILLYAVTGAGKTEMMFQGIQYARRQGDNIAIVSPRVDVVVEISKRIKHAFLNEDID
ncbi:MAG: DEAD/DEAH box helicase family protein, partial [Staphylococcus aureus]|nr:DEAD/DEAH box helicase family protein [Staphylococcus aureus]